MAAAHGRSDRLGNLGGPQCNAEFDRVVEPY
jgi:hypothetical protein